MLCRSKAQDLETLKSFWYAREMPHEAGIIHVIEAYRQSELKERARILSTAMDLFSQSKERALLALAYEGASSVPPRAHVG